MSNRTCTIDGCARPHVAKGLCTLHYNRKKSGVDLNAPVKKYYSAPAEALKARTMPLTETGCLLWMGSADVKGYGRIGIGGKPRLVHRFAWEQAHGPIPEGMQVDHMCWVTSCCNVDHLRLVTQAENNQNRAGAQVTSRSGIRGVYRDKKAGAWRPRVKVDGKTHWGGLYDDKKEAGRVAAEMRSRLMTHSQN